MSNEIVDESSKRRPYNDSKKKNVIIFFSIITILTIVSFWMPTSTAILFWVGLMGVGILHEFGHVVAGKMFGSTWDSYAFNAFGIQVEVSHPDSYKAAFFISLAGPMVNTVAAIVLFLMGNGAFDFTIVAWLNLVWAIFNLLPIKGMDGFNVTNSLIGWIQGRDYTTDVIIQDNEETVKINSNIIKKLNMNALVAVAPDGLTKIYFNDMRDLPRFQQACEN